MRFLWVCTGLVSAGLATLLWLGIALGRTASNEAVSLLDNLFFEISMLPVHAGLLYFGFWLPFKVWRRSLLLSIAAALACTFVLQTVLNINLVFSICDFSVQGLCTESQVRGLGNLSWYLAGMAGAFWLILLLAGCRWPEGLSRSEAGRLTRV
jgi:hypothetical protein